MKFTKVDNDHGSTLITISLFACVLLLLFFFGLFNNNQPMFKRLLNTKVQPSPSMAQSQSSQEYSKKLFTENSKYFQDKPYPQELLMVSEDKLVGIRCNRFYLEDTEDYKPYPEMTEISDLTNLQMGIVEEINNLNPETPIHLFVLCQDEAINHFLLYGLKSSKSNPYPIKPRLAYLNKDLEIIKDVSIPFEGYYGGCYKILQLTKDNHLYFQCSDGDGQFSIASIYNLDLNSGEVKLYASCQTRPSEIGEDDDGMGSRVICSTIQ